MGAFLGNNGVLQVTAVVVSIINGPFVVLVGFLLRSCVGRITSFPLALLPISEASMAILDAGRAQRALTRASGLSSPTRQATAGRGSQSLGGGC